jgi:uncharacterized small protein (DUF1192 family)
MTDYKLRPLGQPTALDKPLRGEAHDCEKEKCAELAEKSDMAEHQATYVTALAKAADEIEALRAELQKRTCCKGCPDCVGIGVGDELRALRAECERLKAELKSKEALSGRFGPQGWYGDE